MSVNTKCKLKKGDTVVVIAGRSKGKTGIIKKVLPKTRKLLVEGVNIIKKHVKPNPQKNIQGGIVTREAHIDYSNVQILNPETNKADKISYKFDENNNKVRVYRSTEAQIDL